MQRFIIVKRKNGPPGRFYRYLLSRSATYHLAIVEVAEVAILP
jgi:hypothetical protein